MKYMYYRVVKFLYILAKYLALVLLILYAFAVAFDYNKINQMKKENIRLSIEVLKLQLLEFENKFNDQDHGLCTTMETTDE